MFSNGGARRRVTLSEATEEETEERADWFSSCACQPAIPLLHPSPLESGRLCAFRKRREGGSRGGIGRKSGTEVDMMLDCPLEDVALAERTVRRGK
jgi:hypothetical protein